MTLAGPLGDPQSVVSVQIGVTTLTAMDIRVAAFANGSWQFLAGAAPTVSIIVKGW